MTNTFTVAADVTYAGAPTDVDTIDFTNAIHTVATATFAASDFDDVKIKDNVLIDGSAGTNRIVVNGGSLDASGWGFTGWSTLADTITINGGGGVDVIIGSSQNDIIVGGPGSDTLLGGDGDDTFVYNSISELAAGEAIIGGNGSADALRLDIGGGSSIDFSGTFVSGVSLTGIEKLVFVSDGGAVFASASFGIGAGQINAVTGSADFNRIDLSGASIDLSGVDFASWGAGGDAIFLQGTAGDNTLIGSSQNDTFLSSNGGDDSLFGGAGDDLFRLAAFSIALGDSIDGGGGLDQIVVRDDNPDLTLVAITGVERLQYDDTGSSVTAKGTQFGSGGFTTVGADIGADLLAVAGSAVDLSDVVFVNWSNGVDSITINGDNAASNTLTGSDQVDTINGGGLNDVLDGGAGADALNGGLGNDTYVLGAENDAVTDTGGSDTITSTIARDLAGFAGIENLTLLGSAAIFAFGDSAANVLDGSQNGAGNLLRGLLGDDTYIVGAGDSVDEVTGGGGTDTVRSLVSNVLGDGVENLTLIGSALNGTGNDLANTITGNAAANVLSGGLGADILIGGTGNDTYVLANGADKVVDSGGTADRVTSTISRTLASFPAIERLTLLGAAAISGTGNGLANVITGNGAANVLKGGLGKDVISAGAGNDRLNGEAGNDTLTSGAGKDIIIFNKALSKTTNLDHVVDFNHFNDTFQLDNAVFAALGVNGALKAAFFHAGAAAADADDHIIYNQPTGALIYDSNGNAAGGAIQFATLTSKPVIAANDFVVI